MKLYIDNTYNLSILITNYRLIFRSGKMFLCNANFSLFFSSKYFLNLNERFWDKEMSAAWHCNIWVYVMLDITQQLFHTLLLVLLLPYSDFIICFCPVQYLCAWVLQSLFSLKKIDLVIFHNYGFCDFEIQK